MNFNKKKGVSTVAILIILAIFNTAIFLLPLKHTLTFWIGYSFAILSAAILLACLLLLFDSQHNERMFLRLPLVKLAWAYFTLQILLSVWEISGLWTSYISALVLNSILTGFYILAILASSVAGEAIEKQDEHIIQKINFIKNAQNSVSQIKVQDEEVAKSLKKLEDDIRFSDPMSNTMLEEIEKQIEIEIVELKSKIDDKNESIKLIECISDLLKERNRKCKMYKGVKGNKVNNDNSGIKYVLITLCILFSILSAVLIVCCVIIPNNIYKNGLSLYDNGKYSEAAEVFENLDNFKESEKMLSTCNEELKKQKYSKAQDLFNNREYDVAIAEFEALGDYENSAEMIQIINQKILEDKYSLAESQFNSQNYVEAVKLYTELDNYKDSKQKIEKIQNRLATDNVLYFGTYNGIPIAWQVIKSDNNKMLLITKDAVCELPYNDEIKNISWSESTLCQWINNEFIKSFSEEQQATIIPQKIDGNEYKIFILKKSDVNSIKDKNILASNCDWWLLSKGANQTNAMYVSQNGTLNEQGETVVRAKGVRPCIWIEL